MKTGQQLFFATYNIITATENLLVKIITINFFSILAIYIEL